MQRRKSTEELELPLPFLDGMSKPTPDPKTIIHKPLTPEPVEGLVKIENPPAEPIIMTADAADMSAIKLLDAADEARKTANPV